MPRKILKKIHINKHVIAQNRKYGTEEPTITCKTSKSNDYGHTVIIRDDNGNEVARIIQAGSHTGKKPLSCGARVWIETKNDVEVIKG